MLIRSPVGSSQSHQPISDVVVDLRQSLSCRGLPQNLTLREVNQQHAILDAIIGMTMWKVSSCQSTDMCKAQYNSTVVVPSIRIHKLVTMAEFKPAL